MHILIVDGDGKITGVPGAVLEKHLNVSKANDAKSPQGDNIYYKDVIKTYSEYLYWGSHETANIYDKNTSNSGVIGVSGVNREFDIIKAADPLNNLDDPTGLNPLAIPLLGTKNRATLRYALQGGADGETIGICNYGTNNFDGYLAETVIIDGTAYNPTTFAESKQGVWVPKDFKDDVTFGTHGVYLKYADASNLGLDSSGNGNTYTGTNMGSDHQSIESPTTEFN